MNIGKNNSKGANCLLLKTDIMKEFNVNQYLEKKMVSLLFFKIGFEYRLEIYNQLDVMLSIITNL